MPRPKFNRETALENTVAVFWQQSFHGTSMVDVSNVTNLKPGSIYLAFGNKEGLFKESLKHYSKKSLKRVNETINSAPSISHGFCNILETMIQESCNKDYCSCFIIKSQLEITQKYPILNKFITELLEQTEQHYIDLLMREYDKETAKIYATSLMLHIFGIRVYGYQQKDSQSLLTSVRQGLPWLPWRN